MLVTAPIIIGGLGAETFGIWSMIQKLSSYVSLADFRAAGAVKLLLSVRQHDDDDQTKRSILGASLVVWLAFLPLLLILAATLLIGAEAFLPVDGPALSAARVALAIFLFGVVMSRVTSLPNNILLAMNLGYRTLFAEIVVPLVTAAMMVISVHVGWGLPGLAAVTVSGLVLDGLLRHMVAVKVVPWYGIGKPTKSLLGSFAGFAGWMQLTNFGNLLLWGADILIVGRLLGGSAAAAYVQTGFLARLATEAVGLFFTSGKAGLAGLVGDGNWSRAAALRVEAQVLALALMTIVGSVILAVNRAFVTRWVGEDLYCGSTVNLLLVIGSVVTTIVRNEAMLIDALLAVKAKAAAMLAAGLVVVGLGIVMTDRYGGAGMAASWIVGLAVLMIFFPAIVSNASNVASSGSARRIARAVIAATAVMTAAHLLKGHVVAESWLGIFGAGAVTAVVAGLLSWILVLDSDGRASLTIRIKSIIPAGGSS